MKFMRRALPTTHQHPRIHNFLTNTQAMQNQRQLRMTLETDAQHRRHHHNLNQLNEIPTQLIESLPAFQIFCIYNICPCKLRDIKLQSENDAKKCNAKHVEQMSQSSEKR